MITELQRSDAFGFHTQSQLQDKFYTSLPSTKRFKDTVLQKLGSTERDYPVRASGIISKITIIKNTLTVAGYIPIIGTIIGIAKLILINKYKSQLDDALNQAEDELNQAEENLKEANERYKNAPDLLKRGISSFRNFCRQSSVDAELSGTSLKISDYRQIISNARSLTSMQKNRSWVEVTSLGFLLIIPDLIFTIGRNLPK
ncbi:MAG: hypothetical protein WDZ27_05375 [Waddliaceae bacterium]